MSKKSQIITSTTLMCGTIAAIDELCAQIAVVAHKIAGGQRVARCRQRRWLAWRGGWCRCVDDLSSVHTECEFCWPMERRVSVTCAQGVIRVPRHRPPAVHVVLVVQGSYHNKNSNSQITTQNTKPNPIHLTLSSQVTPVRIPSAPQKAESPGHVSSTSHGP
jgi:hypothetical protein